MTRSVYGLRVKGSDEVRYVGQSLHGGEHRLQFERRMARGRAHRDAFCQWLRRDDVEVVHLASAINLDEARIAERSIISALLSCGHRLFNIQHVPAASRCPREISATRPNPSAPATLPADANLAGDGHSVPRALGGE